MGRLVTAEGCAGEGTGVQAARVTRWSRALAAPPPGLRTILGGVDPAPTPAAPRLRGSWRGPAAPVGAAPRTGAAGASAAMSGRSVPHAHPATAEYEFANPSRLGEQRFGEGMARTPPHPPCLPPPPTEILG